MLPVVSAQDDQLIGRIPPENLAEPPAPFQWFAVVSLADYCPDGRQGTAGNPATFPGSAPGRVRPRRPGTRWREDYDGPARPLGPG